MTNRRTTVSAESQDLAVLEGEAHRRGVPLAHVLREAVAREANSVRRRTRPRFGIARGDGTATRTVAKDEHAPVRRRGRS